MKKMPAESIELLNNVSELETDTVTQLQIIKDWNAQR